MRAHIFQIVRHAQSQHRHMLHVLPGSLRLILLKVHRVPNLPGQEQYRVQEPYGDRFVQFWHADKSVARVLYDGFMRNALDL